MTVSTTPAAPAAPSAERCAVCDASLGGAFCSECGERRAGAHDYRLGTLAGDVLRDVTSLDGKVLRSIRSLLSAPGDLTAAYFDGRRGRYTKPLSLFVALNVAFFFVVPHTGLLRENHALYLADGVPAHARALATHAAAAHVPAAVYAERFDARLAGYKQSMLLYLIPAFALAVLLTNQTTRLGRRRFAVEHVIFAIHTTTFFLVSALVVLLPTIVGLMLAFGLLGAWTPLGGTLARALDSDVATTVVFCGVVAWYLKHASRRYYGDAPTAATLRAAVLCAAFFGLVTAFRNALFWATLWTT